jgi:hypothetical protein
MDSPRRISAGFPSEISSALGRRFGETSLPAYFAVAVPILRTTVPWRGTATV